VSTFSACALVGPVCCCLHCKYWGDVHSQ